MATENVEFKAIETLEAFEDAVQVQLAENTQAVTAQVKKQFEGWIAPEMQIQQNQALQDEITSLKTTIMRLKIAQETGLPAGLAERLTGADETEIRADAEKLLKFTIQHRTPDFLAEKPETDSRNQAYKRILASLKNQ